MDEVAGLVEDVTGTWPSWLVTATALLLVIVVGSMLLELVLFIALQVTRRTDVDGDEHVVRRLRAPLRAALPFLLALLMRPALGLPDGADEVARRLLAIALIAATTWLAVRTTNALVHLVLQRHRTDVADNLEARRVHTQLRVIARLVGIGIGVVGAAAMLMTFPSIRQLGTSLLASAGIAGLVIGLAAQRTIGNFLAGLQIALSGPIRLDDVVVIDGEWGRIEQITSTYVVVKIWDERRLIVPFSHVIEQPFQNWTRETADVLGTAFVHADYTVPVDAVRDEVRRIAEASDHWDGRAVGLVVTEAGERTVQLRALVSAADASKAWDLRCEVREGIVEFLQREYPEALPRVRAEIGETGE